MTDSKKATETTASPDRGDAMVSVVLEKAGNGLCAAKRGFDGSEWMFAVGVPREVSRRFADALIGNNPEPWQLGGYDVFRIVQKGESGGDE